LKKHQQRKIVLPQNKLNLKARVTKLMSHVERTVLLAAAQNVTPVVRHRRGAVYYNIQILRAQNQFNGYKAKINKIAFTFVTRRTDGQATK
jgi:hypothetical protein